VIDSLREQIQQRLDQLAGEVDRLRKALAALDPRAPSTPAPQGWRTHHPRPPARPVCDAHHEGAGDEEHTGTANEPADCSRPPTDGAWRHQGLSARCAGRRRGADRRPGRREDWARARHRLDKPFQARPERRRAKGPARVSHRPCRRGGAGPLLGDGASGRGVQWTVPPPPVHCEPC